MTTDSTGTQMEAKMSLIQRSTGKIYTILLWFVQQGRRMFFVPSYGSNTMWYKNILTNPNITIDLNGKKYKIKAHVSNDKRILKMIMDMFESKYGSNEVERWYWKREVLVEIALPEEVG